TTGSSYYIACRAADRVTDASNNPDPNYEVTRTTITFYWDVTVPTATVTGATTTAGLVSFGSSLPPPRSSSLASGATFYGGYYDGYSGISTGTLRVFILDQTDNKFWNGNRNGTAGDWTSCVGNEAICSNPGASSVPDSFLVSTNLYPSS